MKHMILAIILSVCPLSSYTMQADNVPGDTSKSPLMLAVKFPEYYDFILANIELNCPDDCKKGAVYENNKSSLPKRSLSEEKFVETKTGKLTRSHDEEGTKAPNPSPSVSTILHYIKQTKESTISDKNKDNS